MIKPKVIVLTGYGINCDEETKYAFELAGAEVKLCHVNDLIEDKSKLGNYQILAFPGGFSFGDDTGAGNALANRIRNHLGEQVRRFVERDKLVLGICNGFQALTNLGLVPALNENYGERRVALVHNDSARYQCEWVDLKFNSRNTTPWLWRSLEMSLPIAHGEGKFFTDSATLEQLKRRQLIAAQYVQGEMHAFFHKKDHNPNGSLEDIAGISDETGKVLGMMPHPERAIHFTQLPNWPIIKEKLKRKGLAIPEYASGLTIFENGVNYFK